MLALMSLWLQLYHYKLSSGQPRWLHVCTVQRHARQSHTSWRANHNASFTSSRLFLRAEYSQRIRSIVALRLSRPTVPLTSTGWPDFTLLYHAFLAQDLAVGCNIDHSYRLFASRCQSWSDSACMQAFKCCSVQVSNQLESGYVEAGLAIEAVEARADNTGTDFCV